MGRCSPSVSGLLSLIYSLIHSGGVQPAKVNKTKLHGHVIKCKGADDFSGYMDAKSTLESAQALLSSRFRTTF